MIPRYSLPEMAAIWSDEDRFRHWLEIEVLAAEAWASLGTVPPENARGVAERWIHFGLTSSDVLDTAFALQLRRAADLLLAGIERLLGTLKRMALEHRDTVMAGRTHGVLAEPTSFGHKLALWAFELDRDRERLWRAREAVSVGKVSGAV